MTASGQAIWWDVVESVEHLLAGLTIVEEDCGTLDGLSLGDLISGCSMYRSLEKRAVGRVSQMDVRHPDSGEVLLGADEVIDESAARRLCEADVCRVWCRSPFTCQSENGICVRCFGSHPVSGKPVAVGKCIGEALVDALGSPDKVGVWALPGWQTGEFPEEMRSPSAGTVRFGALPPGSHLVPTKDTFGDREPALRLIDKEVGTGLTVHLEPGGQTFHPQDEALLLVRDGEQVEPGALLYRQRNGYRRLRFPEEFGPLARLFEALPVDPDAPLARLAPIDGTVKRVERSAAGIEVRIMPEIGTDFALSVDGEVDAARTCVFDGDPVRAGEKLMRGALDLHDVFRVMGEKECLDVWLEEILVHLLPYGWDIADRYLEIVFRVMCQWLEVREPGSLSWQRGQIVHRSDFARENQAALDRGRKPVIAVPILLGVSEARQRTRR